jgi:hypothetical protein
MSTLHLLSLLAAIWPSDLRKPDLWQCGPQALYAHARMAGVTVAYQEILELTRASPYTGCTAADLVNAAKAIGFHETVAVKTTVRDLAQLNVPFILGDGVHHHFVAVVGESPTDHVWIGMSFFGRLSGEIRIPKQSGRHRGWNWEGWDGTAILLSKTRIEQLTRPPGRILPFTIGLGVGAAAGLAYYGGFRKRMPER